jgi:hypothetical protein
MVKLLGLKTPEGTIPLMALKEISDALLHGSERALRLSVEGASVRKGKIPGWLSKSLEFTITGISKGSTVLEIEAPTLAQSALEQVQQQTLWYTLPNPEDTAISLLSRSVRDATSGQMESEHYDRGVLTALLSFETPLKKYISDIEVNSETKQRDNFKIGQKELDKVSWIKAETPEPHAVVIAGSFNLIEHTQGRFQLSLEDGRNIPGRADLSFVTHDLMRTLWGKKVTAKGVAHFNPSGKIRFIEAQIIKSFEPGEEVFENLLEIRSLHGVVEEQKRKQQLRSPLKEIWGQWPGEESIDEILSQLKEMSTESV